MTSLRPLVIQDGLVSELSQGDTVQTGGSSTEVVAGSGLVGGGSIGPNIRLDFAVAPNPSGVIYVGDTIGNDGVASVNATVALASGNKAATEGSTALSSGNAALSTAVGALASGNAALDLVPTLVGGGPTAVLTAASAVASGYSVGVDDAGKVQSIGLTVTSNPLSFPSSEVVFESASSVYYAPIYDSSNNRVVISYQDAANSSYGTSVVGTVSGTSITFGTAVVFQSSASYYIASTYDSTNNKVVIAYYGNSGYGTAIVGTVSGTSISFGSAVVFESAVIGQPSVTYDSTNNRVVIVYPDDANSYYGTSIVGTVSGTSISFGTAVVFESASTSFISATYDSTNDRVVIAYQDIGNSSYGTAIVGTVSGTSISFGTPVVFASDTSTYLSAIYDSAANKVVIAYRDDGNSGYSNAIVGTVSGSSISFDTAVVFASSDNYYIASTYDSTNNNVVISYRDAGNSDYGTAIVANTLGGTTSTPTLNSYPNFLGISQSTVASGSPCLVNLPGALYTDPTAGLTTGEFYYVDPTTSGVTTTSTKPTSWDGQVPWNYIGRAVTSSGLMLLKSI